MPTIIIMYFWDFQIQEQHPVLWDLAGLRHGENIPSNPPSPIDNQQYLSHYRNTALFGKKLNSSNIRRVVKKVNWAFK